MRISTAKAGITRLRDKGGASKDSLYDGLNCYVTHSSSVRPRPGTTRAYVLPAGTKGLCAFRDKLHVFASTLVVSSDPAVVINILRHPTSTVAALVEIWFAAPFLGFLYVVAEWDTGEIFHYWLQETGTWQANHVYRPGEVVQPTVPNGYAYQAVRTTDPNPVWTPNVARTMGEVIEPTDANANGYKYTVIDLLGDNPRSGAVEPTWIASDGAIVYEDTSGAPTGGGTAGGTGTSTPPPDVQDRYGNQGGYCVVSTMWVDDDRFAGEVDAGDFVDAHTPEKGYHRAGCQVAGDIRLEPCVRITTDNGAVWEGSTTTPINFAEADRDMEDGKWAFAPYVIGQNLLTDKGASQVVEVLDIGYQPVKPLDFGGVSFAAGNDPRLRIYTHNMAKFLGTP